MADGETRRVNDIWKQEEAQAVRSATIKVTRWGQGHLPPPLVPPISMSYHGPTHLDDEPQADDSADQGDVAMAAAAPTTMVEDSKKALEIPDTVVKEEPCQPEEEKKVKLKKKPVSGTSAFGASRAGAGLALPQDAQMKARDAVEIDPLLLQRVDNVVVDPPDLLPHSSYPDLAHDRGDNPKAAKRIHRMATAIASQANLNDEYPTMRDDVGVLERFSGLVTFLNAFDLF